MRICYLSWSYIIVSGIFWSFGLYVGQNKTSEDFTWCFRILSQTFFTVFCCFIDKTRKCYCNNQAPTKNPLHPSKHIYLNL